MEKSLDKTILLVEDESVTATLISNQLKKFGYNVIHVNNGEISIKIALGPNRIDLILMDIDLGDGIKGTQAAIRILKEKEIPIVFHTSHSEREYVNQVKKITRYGYIVKNSGSFILESSIAMAFELFEANRMAKEKKEYYKSFFWDNHFPVMIIDPQNGQILDANKKAIEFYGWDHSILLQKEIYDINYSSKEEIYLEMEAAKTQKKNFFQSKQKTAQNIIVDVEIYSGPINFNGKTVLCSSIYEASKKKSLIKKLKKKNEELEYENKELRTALEKNKKLLQEKEILLKETHHRIKNNMTTINSFLSLQANSISNKLCKNILLSTCSRIRSMMNLYDLIYHNNSFQNIEAKIFLEKLTKDIINNYSNISKIQTNVNTDDIHLKTDITSSIAMIINELMINSIKHAFNGIKNPEITIHFQKIKERVILSVKDNGIGLPDNFDINNFSGFGMELVLMLTEQINGTLQYKIEKGTEFVISYIDN